MHDGGKDILVTPSMEFLFRVSKKLNRIIVNDTTQSVEPRRKRRPSDGDMLTLYADEMRLRCCRIRSFCLTVYRCMRAWFFMLCLASSDQGSG
mmetsp:Transcript_7603/g.16564  ORF Transcript_7603/g.16564 Transcript_7603/m.16564 type:complete len:93 (-) Transcript_7603:418-696(-)